MIIDIATGKHIVASTPSTYVWFMADRDISPYAKIGDVRLDHNQIIVYDGSHWVSGGGNAYVSLTPTAESAIDWVTKKMAEEEELSKLMKEYPALQEAKAQFDAMLALVKDPSFKEKV